MREFLDRALDEDLGIRIRSSDPERLRQRLYAVRRETAYPPYDTLAFKVQTDPITGPELWIIRKDATNAPEEG